MKTRIISAICGLSIFLFVMLAHNNILLYFALGVLASIGIYEAIKALNCNNKGFYIVTGGILAFAFAFSPLYDIKTVVLLSIILLTLNIIFLFRAFPRLSVGETLEITGLQIIIAFAFGSVAQLYFIKQGIFLVWLPFISAWLTDTFAYFTGRAIGRHKLTAISPKKTVEGAVGGVLGAILGFVVFTYICDKFGCSLNYLYMIILGIVTSVLSQIGDIFASAVKREKGIKDFGKLMPGHGGVLDRFDSVLITAPFIYIFVSLFNIMG